MVSKIIEIINGCRSFLITSHVRLDGDALGSELALYDMLRRMKRNPVIYNQDETPSNCRFLPGSETIANRLPPLEKFDAAFVLDCSDLERVGKQAHKIGEIKQIIAIDHHISRQSFTDIAFIDHQASSTGELLYRLAKQMSLEFTPEMATNLYAAIMTDTGGFRYGSTKSATLIAAGDLVEKGADPQWISENIYESKPLAKINLLMKVMETLTFDCGGKICSMVVLKKVIESAGALAEHTEGFVDIPRSIEGVEVSILYNEISSNYFKISFRSKGKINIEQIAGALGGGGHINASACEIEGDIETIRHRVIEMTRHVVE